MTVDAQKLALQALAGHGHVKPRADGVKARCGGPAICRVCQQEKVQMEMAEKVRSMAHPLDGLHINQGSMDAAADAYEAEFLRHKIASAIELMERTAAGHAIGADKADDANGYQGGFAAGFRSCLKGFREALK